MALERKVASSFPLSWRPPIPSAMLSPRWLVVDEQPSRSRRRSAPQLRRGANSERLSASGFDITLSTRRLIFHRREDRIVGHVQLCWLALLLIRTLENQVGDH